MVEHGSDLIAFASCGVQVLFVESLSRPERR